MRGKTQRLQKNISLRKKTRNKGRLRFVSGMVRGRVAGGPVGDTEPADWGLLGMAVNVIFRVIEGR